MDGTLTTSIIMVQYVYNKKTKSHTYQKIKTATKQRNGICLQLIISVTKGHVTFTLNDSCQSTKQTLT